MAYPKHTLFYSAVLEKVQTHSVACCGFRYCGVRHNPTVYRNILLHLPRMGIKSNLNSPKQRKQSRAKHLYCRLFSVFARECTGMHEKAKCVSRLLWHYFVHPGKADMHDPDPTHSASTSDMYTCPTLITLLWLQIAFESRSRCLTSLFAPFDKFVRIRGDNPQDARIFI